MADRRGCACSVVQKRQIEDHHVQTSQRPVNSHFEKVTELLRLESAAIACASERLDRENVERAVALILDCGGKIVAMGVGKSGIIAQKIAQTLTSTGTVAISVHPSDAMHGGLGAISKGDLVIALSNSGETEDLVAILPSLRAKSVSLV